MCDRASNRCACFECQAKVQVQPLEASKHCVICNGDEMGIPVKCGDPRYIDVAQGYYRPEGIDPARSLMQGNETAIDLDVPPVMAVPCPWGLASCLGGRHHGNASCEEGHYGVFCASCEQGWYRSSDRCRLCPQDTLRAIAVTAIIVGVSTIVLVLMALYLRTASTSTNGSHVFLGDCCPTLARTLARLPPSTHRQVAATLTTAVPPPFHCLWPTPDHVEASLHLSQHVSPCVLHRSRPYSRSASASCSAFRLSAASPRCAGPTRSQR